MKLTLPITRPLTTSVTQDIRTGLGGAGNRGSLTIDWANSVYERNGIIYPSFTALLAAASGTFSRNSISYNRAATQSFAANVPRIELAGLLYEPARTNWLLRTQAFDLGDWGYGGSARAANTHAAPDGTLTADSLTAGGYFNQLIQASQIHGLANGTNTVFSLWAKAISGATDMLLDNQGTGSPAPTVALNATTWTRGQCTAQVANISNNVFVYNAGPPGVQVYWGAQFEEGLEATSYIPNLPATGTAPASRPADVMTLVLPAACTLTYGDGTTQAVPAGVWTPAAQAGAKSILRSLVMN